MAERGGRHPEHDAKTIIVQILGVVAFCHLQGVVHRDLKPENFLFTTRDEDSPLKIIDFGLSDFIRPDKRLNDIVGSTYYVASEVLQYGSRYLENWRHNIYLVMWKHTFLGTNGVRNFSRYLPWPVVSPEAKDFIKRFLNKDHMKRMTAAQALITCLSFNNLSFEYKMETENSQLAAHP
ncbi:hypothetical protein C5167_021888, partial [Papaver somniferum]